MSPGVGHIARQNRILRALPAPELDEVVGRARLVSLDFRDVVYGHDEEMSHVHFPGSGVLSIMHVVDDGAEIEVATVGNEGMVGLPLFFGTDRYPGRCFSQVPGLTARLPAGDFRALAGPATTLHDRVQRYVQALMVQMGQNAACNQRHRVDARCARWILTTHDRVDGDEFPLTQEFLARMLGVRRPSVSAAASALQRDGLIRYRRGTMAVTDRGGLLRHACSCYSVIRREVERALP